MNAHRKLGGGVACAYREMLINSVDTKSDNTPAVILQLYTNTVILHDTTE
jgi:hypothetical protein